jgi:hypothetical protein
MEMLMMVSVLRESLSAALSPRSGLNSVAFGQPQ